MVKLRSYISVKNALKAIELYQKIFNAKMVSHMPVDKNSVAHFGLSDVTDLSKTTMHSTIKIGEEMIYLSDNFTGEVLEKTNIAIAIEPDSLEQMREFYNNAEKTKCKITMNLEKQFWGDYFASFVDEFGINWQMNYTPKD